MASKIEVDEIFNAGGDNDTGIDLATNDVVKVKTANTERMRVDSGGDVGIGVSPETDHYGAYVNVNFGVSGLVGSNASGTNTTFLTNNAYLNTGPNWIYKETDEATKYNQSAGKHIWEGAASGSAGGTISFTERMTLDASGNLLVAKTSSDGSVVGFEARATGMAIATRDNGTPLYARRIGSGSNDDEDILEFQNADGKVGAIGSLSGHLYIGDGDTAISPRNDLDSILPSNMSSYGGRDDAIDIGYSSTRFDDIYASNGTIQTSDKNLKEDIASLTSAEMKVGARLSKLFKTFRWKSKVAEKGDKARTHNGIIAQDVADAFTAEGLDATKYGLYGSNTWDVDKDGQDTVIANTSKVGEKTRLSIRYPELLCFVSAYNEQRFTDIEARIKKLEDG